MKSELRKKQYNVTLFDSNHLAHVIVLWQIQKFMCLEHFSLFYFEFAGNFRVQSPGGLYLEGRFIGRLFALRVWGVHIWRGLFSEFCGNLQIDHARFCFFTGFPMFAVMSSQSGLILVPLLLLSLVAVGKVTTMTSFMLLKFHFLGT